MAGIENALWKTKAGEVLRLGDMTHCHLENAISHQQRRSDKWDAEAMSASGYSGGEAAEHEAGIAADHAFEKMQSADNNIRLLTAEKYRRQSLSTVDDAIEIMQSALGA